jgi:hypothetical protein
LPDGGVAVDGEDADLGVQLVDVLVDQFPVVAAQG